MAMTGKDKASVTIVEKLGMGLVGLPLSLCFFSMDDGVPFESLFWATLLMLVPSYCCSSFPGGLEPSWGHLLSLRSFG